MKVCCVLSQHLCEFFRLLGIQVSNVECFALSLYTKRSFLAVLKHSKWLFLAAYGFSFFISNAGANTTTYVLPSEAFPTKAGVRLLFSALLGYHRPSLVFFFFFR
jgi:hypothetical protein